MAKSQQTFNKSEKEKKRLKKRKEKQQRLEERRANNSKGKSLDDMIAYVDENGQISDTPPDPTKKKKIKAENIDISIPKKVEEEIDPVHEGKVDFYNDAKGFGFIRDAVSQEKYFFHVNGLIDDVSEGYKVSFELEKGMKGLNAVRVKKI